MVRVMEKTIGLALSLNEMVILKCFLVHENWTSLSRHCRKHALSRVWPISIIATRLVAVPCFLFFRGTFVQNFGRFAPRDRELMFEI